MCTGVGSWRTGTEPACQALDIGNGEPGQLLVSWRVSRCHQALRTRRCPAGQYGPALPRAHHALLRRQRGWRCLRHVVGAAPMDRHSERTGWRRLSISERRARHAQQTLGLATSEAPVQRSRNQKASRSSASFDAVAATRLGTVKRCISAFECFACQLALAQRSDAYGYRE